MHHSSQFEFTPSRVEYAVVDGSGNVVDVKVREMADAAQDAEHLHAETGSQHWVTDPSGEIVYESKGPVD